jgi:hypothetical protein
MNIWVAFTFTSNVAGKNIIIFLPAHPQFE